MWSCTNVFCPPPGVNGDLEWGLNHQPAEPLSETLRDLRYSCRIDISSVAIFPRQRDFPGDRNVSGHIWRGRTGLTRIDKDNRFLFTNGNAVTSAVNEVSVSLSVFSF